MQPTDPFGVTEQERPLLFAQLVHPQSEVWRVLRAGAKARTTDREESRQRVAEVHKRFTTLAADLADALHHLRGFLNANQDHLIAAGLGGQVAVLNGIAEKQEAALRHAGVRLLDPVGTPFEAQPWVEVRHAQAVADLDGPIIARTLQPGVLLETGELVRPAQVVVHEPPPEEPEQQLAPEPEQEPVPPEPEQSLASTAQQPERAPVSEDQERVPPSQDQAEEGQSS